MDTLKVLYEDNHLIAVYKPAGILIQAGDRKSGNLLDEVRNHIKEKYKKPGNAFIGLVHRLDKPVSGIVVFAKTSKGASRLSEQFRERDVAKSYTALVQGEVRGSGELVNYLKKDPDKLIAVISEEEKPGYQRAELDYEALKTGKNYSLLKINLKTGRFNQIRVQLSHVGHPIVGDKLYGAVQKMEDGSIGLCSTEITFRTATTDEEISLKVDYPKEWDAFVNK